VDNRSIPAVLREHAEREPDAVAFTFLDYQLDPRGYPESLTRSELQRRVQALAGELASCGAPGDRIAICAPQCLDYVIGFLGAMAAGYIAVPLPVPALGMRDERVSGAIKDSGPVAILTTSDSVDAVVPCARDVAGSAPSVIELDALGLDMAAGSGLTDSETTRPQTKESPQTKEALLQYTSGSTRAPAAVVVTHRNVIANLDQAMEDYFEDNGRVPLPGTRMVSWLPFYHDMGLLLGVMGPVLRGFPAVLMSPTAFLQKPARWMQALAGHHSSFSATPHFFSAAPNFAFELAARRTKDEDMAGLDLGNVHTILSGAERVHAATIRRFNERFSSANLPVTALKPSYGLAEAMVYVASSTPGHAPVTARFDYEKLSSGYAERSEKGGGSELVGLGRSRACTWRIVDPETCQQNPAGKVGEIWVHGENVVSGYWRNPQLTEKTFGGRIADPSPGTPEGPWLRTGDLGVISDDELFIVGRIKDLLIVDGRNHYPDDIESTIQEVTVGRSAAISVPDGQREQLVTIIEFKQRESTAPGSVDIRSVKQRVRTAVSESHGLRVADVVVVPPGSLPITTSGKIRRSACAQQYLQDKFAGIEILA